MTDEQDQVLDLEELDRDIEKTQKVEKRIRDLSEKVRLTSEERDEQARLLKERDQALNEKDKTIEFLTSFGDATQKYPDAIGFRDAIKEKVLKGYSVEDATVAVLAQEGKLSNQSPQLKEGEKTIEKAPQEQKSESKIENPAGGSAINRPLADGSKSIGEMTRDEKLAALLEAERRGDLGVS